MKYENFDEAAELVKEIKALEAELRDYKSPNVRVIIRTNASEIKMETWPFCGQSDGTAFEKYATEMLTKLGHEAEAKIRNLKSRLEAL